MELENDLTDLRKFICYQIETCNDYLLLNFICEMLLIAEQTPPKDDQATA